MAEIPPLNLLLLWLGAASALVAVLWALSQTDVKRLLAYHSVSQMGFIVAAFGAGGTLGLTAGLYHSLGHAAFKSLLFLSLGAVISSTGERDVYRLGRLSFRLPLVFGLFLVGALAITGLPPLAGYAGKKLITEALDSGDPSGVAGLMIRLASWGTLASFLKLTGLFGVPWLRPGSPAPQPAPRGAPAHPGDSDARAEHAETGAHAASDGKATVPEHEPSGERPGWTSYAGMGLLALLCVLMGLRPHVWAAWLATLASPGAVFIPPAVYSPSGAVDTAVTLLGGLLIYFLAVRGPLKAPLGRLRDRELGINGALAVFVTSVVSVVALLWYSGATG